MIETGDSAGIDVHHLATALQALLMNFALSVNPALWF